MTLAPYKNRDFIKFQMANRNIINKIILYKRQKLISYL